jgi:DNA-binding transcriptional MerR regulator
VLDVAKQAGFSLDEIRLLFDATEGGTPAHAQLKELATRKIPEIEVLIAQAQEIRSWLEMTRACTCDTLDQCSLFDQDFPENSGDGCSTREAGECS